MYFEDIPYFRAFSEVENRVTEIVLAASDSAEFLSGDGYGLKDICDLCGTIYENIIPAFVSCRSGESWGMSGTLFSFKLTDALKKHILEEGLDCIFGEQDRLFLENLTLFDGEKIVFSCCSHEVFSLFHMAEVDDTLSEQISNAVETTIKSMPLYNKMREIAANLSEKPKEEMEKDIEILSDLCWYVDEATELWFYQLPRYKCNFPTFKNIAKRYLTAETYAVLSPLNSFSALQPLSVAKTTNDVLIGVGKGIPQFLQSEYYHTLMRELNMLKFILEERNGDTEHLRK